MANRGNLQNMGASIVGRVTTPEGAPVTDAAVMITADSPSHKDIAALTDAKGAYRFDGLTAGKYTLLVNAEGYPSQTGQAHVEPGQVTQLNFSLQK